MEPCKCKECKCEWKTQRVDGICGDCLNNNHTKTTKICVEMDLELVVCMMGYVRHWREDAQRRQIKHTNNNLPTFADMAKVEKYDIDKLQTALHAAVSGV